MLQQFADKCFLTFKVKMKTSKDEIICYLDDIEINMCRAKLC